MKKFLILIILICLPLSAQQQNFKESQNKTKNNQNYKDNATMKDEMTKKVIVNFYDILLNKKSGEITDLFAENVDWDLPGNNEKFPWVGKRKNKREIAEFFRLLSEKVKPEMFNIDFIAINGENATVVGNLASRILQYDKVFNSEFVAIFKVRDGKIIKYHFLEDSYKLNEMMK